MKKRQSLCALTMAAAMLLCGCGMKAMETPGSLPAESASSAAEPQIQVPLEAGPYQWIERVWGVQPGPLYEGPGTDTPILLELESGMSNEPVRIQQQNGWSQCVIGDVIGWVPDDRINDREWEKEPIPTFLPKELQLLYVKALNLYNVYLYNMPCGYCGWDQHMDEGENSIYCRDCIYPSKAEWTAAVEGVFGQELSQAILSKGADPEYPIWKEKDGELYFAQGDGGSFGPSNIEFALLESTKERIVIEASVKWLEEQPWKVAQDIELVKGADGWRFESFASLKSNWDHETAIKEYQQKEAQNAPRNENGDPIGVLYSPAFLDEEQRAVYEKAAQYVDSIPHSENFGFERIEGEEGTVWVGEEQYQLYEPGYEEWMRQFGEVFSEKCVMQLQNSGIFRDWDGHLAVKIFVDRSTVEGWSRVNEYIPDQYELVSKTDGSVEFRLIGYYERWDAGADKPTAYTKDYPIRLIKTENGWRVDEMHSTLYG